MQTFSTLVGHKKNHTVSSVADQLTNTIFQNFDFEKTLIVGITSHILMNVTKKINTKLYFMKSSQHRLSLHNQQSRLTNTNLIVQWLMTMIKKSEHRSRNLVELSAFKTFIKRVVTSVMTSLQFC